MRKLIFIIPLIVFALTFAATIYLWVEPADACPYRCYAPDYCSQSACERHSDCTTCLKAGNCWRCPL